MKISKTTLTILNSFTSMNLTCHIHPGSVLMTYHPQKVTMGRATVPETFPRECHFYNLPELLSVLTLFDDPDVEFFQDHLVVSSDNNSISYRYSSPDTVTNIDLSKKITVPPDALVFEITKEDFKLMDKAISIIRDDVWRIYGDGKDVYVSTLAKSVGKPSFKMKVTESEKEFQTAFSLEGIKMIPENYTVTVAPSFVSFAHASETMNITYWVVAKHV